MPKKSIDPVQRTLFESLREKKKILLVEPYYKRTLVPLPLMKISAWHKSRGDEVKYQRGEGWFINNYEPNIIYITSLFTWDYYTLVRTINSYKARFPNAEIKVGGTCASLLSKDIEKDTGIKPHFGAWDEVDQTVPDYSLFPNIDYSLGVTTRSCIRKCLWCFAWRVDGEYREIKNWDKLIDLSKPRIIFMDNNFLACSDEHFYSVIKKLREINKPFDWNQSLDCRLFTVEKVKALSETKMFPTRFSFDGMHEDGPLQEAMKLAKKYGIGNDIRVDVLYGFKDSPEDFYYRLKEIVCGGGKAFPMRYQELTAKQRNTYIGEHWTANLIRGFQKLLSLEFSNGIIGPTTDSKEMFERKCGKNAQEFIEKINMYEKKEDINQRHLRVETYENYETRARSTSGRSTNPEHCGRIV